MASCWGCKGMFTLANDMKVTKFIANMIAFSPPTKVNYEIEEEKNNTQEEKQTVEGLVSGVNSNVGKTKSRGRGACYKKIKFIHRDFAKVNYPWIDINCYQIQKCSTKKRIVLLHIKNTTNDQKNNKKRQNERLTFIFSHGNACDLSGIYSFLIDLSTQTKSDVIAYDYSGYGRSEGTPSEKEVYTDIEQVMDFVNSYLYIKTESIVLIGNSMGSVPTVHIAVQEEYSDIKGLILISPIGSGMKLVNPKLSMNTVDLEKIDVFCNLSKVSSINCPVFLIHGMQDEVIPQSQSKDMMNKIKCVYEWFPRAGTHTNILVKYRYKFYSKVKLFIDHLNYTGSAKKKFLADSGNKNDTVNTSDGAVIYGRNTKRIKCDDDYIKCEFDGNGINYRRLSSPIRSKFFNFNTYKY